MIESHKSVAKKKKKNYNKEMAGNFLAFQWIELGIFTAGAWVQSPVGEITSNILHAIAKKKKGKDQKLDFSLGLMTRKKVLMKGCVVIFTYFLQKDSY